MKRFYTNVTVAGQKGAFEVLLDGKRIRTPRGHTVCLPTSALASAVAAEWQSRAETFEPSEMQLTALANAAIDRIESERDLLIDTILGYGGSDLLCYRAVESDLAAQQAIEWDPVLNWLEQAHRARLNITAGIGHIDQPAEALAALRGAVEELDAFALTALKNIVTITGSLVLALAAMGGHMDILRAFNLSRLDEDDQARKWGEDAMATELAKTLAAELAAAAEFLKLSRP